MEEKTKNIFTTKNAIILLAIVTAIALVYVIIINVINSKLNSGDEQSLNPSEVYHKEVADTISGMVGTANLDAEYIISQQRNILYLIGSQKYYLLQYNSETKILYVLDGVYSSTGLTDEQRIKEAKEKTTGNEKLFDGITLFGVENADINGKFQDGKITFTLAVEKDGKFTRKSFTATVPQ